MIEYNPRGVLDSPAESLVHLHQKVASDVVMGVGYIYPPPKSVQIPLRLAEDREGLLPIFDLHFVHHRLVPLEACADACGYLLPVSDDITVEF